MKHTATRRQKVVFVFLTFLLLTGFLVALLEAAMRVRQRIKYGTANPSIIDLQVHQPSGLRIPVPRSNTGSIRINSLGFRGPEIEDPKPRGRIRLAFLGGSTTFCAEVTSNDATWPHYVWRKMQAAFPGVEFDYVNAGVPGYSTSELIAALEHRVKPLKPDVIVIYETTNDLSYDTRELAQKQGLFRGKADDPSWLASVSVAWNLIEKNLLIHARQRAAASSEGRLVFKPTQLSQGFRLRLAELLRASKEVSPIVAVAMFSTRFRREQSQSEQIQAANTSLYYMPYMTVSGLLDAFEEYNAVIREIAQETGSLLIGGEHDIPGDGLHFNDSVHFNDRGSKIMAERVATGLIQSGMIKAIVRR